MLLFRLTNHRLLSGIIVAAWLGCSLVVHAVYIIARPRATQAMYIYTT